MNNKELEIEILKINDKILYQFVDFYGDLMNKMSGVDIILIIANTTELLSNNLRKLKYDILIENEKNKFIKNKKGENKNGKN